MSKMKVILSSALLLITTNVLALPIGGTIEMGGSFFALDSNGRVTNDASLATAIDFDFFGYDKFVVNTADGDFTGLDGKYGDIKDITFDPFIGPVADFWSIGDFSFELTDLTRGFTENPKTFLVLNGLGTLSAAGFDDTVATWSFSGDTTGTGVFSWSSTSVATADVPEPSLLLLLSIGLIGIGIRKKV